MTRLVQQLHDELVRRQYAASTIESYVKIVEAFRQHSGKRLDRTGPDDLRHYHVYLLEDRKLAVGTVVMNRVYDARYPKSVCGVVGQKNQFAQGVLTKKMTDSGAVLASQVADQVLRGARHPGVGNAQHFHTAGLRFPYNNMYYVLEAGGNEFYEKRTPGTF